MEAFLGAFFGVMFFFLLIFFLMSQFGNKQEIHNSSIHPEKRKQILITQAGIRKSIAKYFESLDLTLCNHLAIQIEKYLGLLPEQEDDPSLRILNLKQLSSYKNKYPYSLENMAIDFLYILETLDLLVCDIFNNCPNDKDLVDKLTEIHINATLLTIFIFENGIPNKINQYWPTIFDAPVDLNSEEMKKTAYLTAELRKKEKGKDESERSKAMIYNLWNIPYHTRIHLNMRQIDHSNL